MIARPDTFRAAFPKPLLSIGIPTHNRVGFVRPLVAFLIDEIEAADLGAQVEIFVADNASTDGTVEALAKYSRPFLRVVAHSVNRGAGYNVRYCLSESRADHVWILGDDDRPAYGLLAELAKLVAERTPGLIYLLPTWVEDARLANAVEVRTKSFRKVSPGYFACAAGVTLSFLSSFIIDKTRLASISGPFDVEAEADPWLPQLHWLLPVLDNSDELYVATAPLLLATSGNSGSYNALRVFGTLFEDLTRRNLTRRPRLARAIVDDVQERFLPPLIWKLRVGTAGRFGSIDEEDLKSIAHAYRQRPVWRFIALALAKAPLILGRPLYVVSAALGGLARGLRLAASDSSCAPDEASR